MNEKTTATPSKRSRVIVVMGVSGSGKSTVGSLLARGLRWEFFDADDYHSETSRAKMKQGIALTDADREPWLSRLEALITGVLGRGTNAVLACSALRQVYRDKLAQPGVEMVYLKGSFELIRSRLQQRPAHFFDPDLLRSQFATLEEPARTLTVDIDRPPSEIVDEIIGRLDV